MPASRGARDFDLKIVNGFIVDGTGAPGCEGDIGIRDGRIAAVGEAPGSAVRTIDAAGQAVCPGFVDIHTHYDAQIMWDRMLTISPWHGVTTVVMGNCGFSRQDPGRIPVRSRPRERPRGAVPDARREPRRGRGGAAPPRPAYGGGALRRRRPREPALRRLCDHLPPPALGA